MIKAIARVVTGNAGFPRAFTIVTCTADRSFEGSTWTAPRDTYARVGDHVVVKFTPEDQFAYEVSL